MGLTDTGVLAYLVPGVHNIIRPRCVRSVLHLTPEEVSRDSLQVRVCLQMAVTLVPAVAGMILEEGCVGLGGPLQAMLFDMTSD